MNARVGDVNMGGVIEDFEVNEVNEKRVAAGVVRAERGGGLQFFLIKLIYRRERGYVR